MRIVYMGTPEFARVSLKALLEAGHDVCAVFTRPDAPSGRGKKLSASPVKQEAAERQIDVYQPTKLRDGTAAHALHLLRPDLVVVVAYGRLLPDELLAIAPLGCVNVHASLLPKYRGAAPIQWAVIQGERETGVTTQMMAAELDAGDILMQRATKILPDETAGQLQERLAPLGAELLVETVSALSAGTAVRTPQDGNHATFAPMLQKQDGQIDWTKPAALVESFVRGMSPWPGAQWGDLRVHRVEPLDESAQAEAGTMLPGGLVVCGDARILRLAEVQAAGGKRMSFEAYARGHQREKC